MFSFEEVDACKPMLDGFMEELLSGNYGRVINYIKAQKQLEYFFCNNFDRTKTADQLIIEFKDKYKKNKEQYLLFNMLMLWHDEYCLMPWLEICGILINVSPLHAYKCLNIYQYLMYRELSHKKAELFYKWETLRKVCVEKGLWAESFSVALKQYNISRQYLKHFITHVDYFLDKLLDLSDDDHHDKYYLIQEIKKILMSNKNDKNHSEQINAILNELHGDMDSSMNWRIKDYRIHKDLMRLVRKLSSIKEYERLEDFLKKELEANPQNKEVLDGLKRIQILKLAENIKDKELVDKVKEAVYKGPLVPSGKELFELLKAFDNDELRKTGVSVFRLFKELYPVDHELYKYYGRMLEADGQIDDAFNNYKLMFLLKSEPEKIIEDIRMIVLSALIHDRYEDGYEVFSKLKDMKDLKGEKDNSDELCIQTEQELEALMSFYKKINESPELRPLIKAFKNICFKARDYDCIGIVKDLEEDEHWEIIKNEEVSRFINNMAVYTKKIIHMKFYLVTDFIESMEKDGRKLQSILAIAETIDKSLYAALAFVYENKGSDFEGINEALRILKSQNRAYSTLKVFGHILHTLEDDMAKKFVMLLMTSFFDRRKIIRSIFESSDDAEKNKKLISEICQIYIRDLKEDSKIYMDLGFDLVRCFYFEDAKKYFHYAMNNLTEEDGASVSQLMYYVCDLLMRMGKGMEINPADYEKKSFFAKALFSIVQRKEYSDYVSRYISAYENSSSDTIIVLSAFSYLLTQEYDKAQEELKKIQHDKEFYEACKELLRSLLSNNDEFKEADEIEEEAAAEEEKEEHYEGYDENTAGLLITGKGYKDMDEVDDEAPTAEKLNREAEIIDDFLEIEHIEDAEAFIEGFLKHTPLLAEIIQGEEDIEYQYEELFKVADPYVGQIVKDEELFKKRDASLKAAAAAKKMKEYEKFFTYMAEFCEAELELRIKDRDYKRQVALAYETHLMWYARYTFFDKNRINIDRSDKKLGYYHLRFFKAFALMDDLSDILENLSYVRRISVFLSRKGCEYIKTYQKKYRYGKKGIMNLFISFAEEIEKYSAAESIEDKKKFLNNAIRKIERMGKVADYQFFKIEKSQNINPFLDCLLRICNKELKMLENKPAVKVHFLNRENIHIIAKDNKLQGSFHFLIANEGQGRAYDFSCKFKLMKDGEVLGTLYEEKNVTLREKEKLPIGFIYEFEKEGQYEIWVETKYADGPFKTISYSIDVKASDFVFDRITEGIYPTAPVSDESKFFGRKVIVQRIKDHLYNDGDRTTFLIYGLRRVGKTSLLNYIESIMKDRFYPIQCDCQGVFDADNTGKLVYRLFVENIAEGLENYYGIDIDKPLEEDFEKEPFQQLNIFFKAVEKSIGDKSLLILVDEFDDVVYKVQRNIYSKDLYNFIRAKMQHSDKTRFLIAGGEYLLNIMKDGALKISDSAMPLEVGFMEPDEAREMIIKPLSQNGVLCIPEAVDLIIRITSGHPYFLTAICNKLVELLNKEKNRYVIYPDDVVKASEKLMDSTNTNMYLHFWNSLNDAYKKLVVATIGELSEHYNDYVDMDILYERMKEVCASASLPLDLYRDRIRSKINELESGRILSTENKDKLAVRISVEQLRLWTKKKKDINTVVKEIKAELEKTDTVLNN